MLVVLIGLNCRLNCRVFFFYFVVKINYKVVRGVIWCFFFLFKWNVIEMVWNNWNFYLFCFNFIILNDGFKKILLFC